LALFELISQFVRNSLFCADNKTTITTTHKKYNMKLQKQLTAALAGAVFFGSVANAEIPLTDELSAYGYIDMALTDGEDTGDTETTVAEFELGFAFTSAESAWSAVSELSFDGTEAAFETVTISYAYSDELSFTAGNILSYQGFETYDATGLYQFSYAGIGGAPLYTASYAVGACADYVTEDYALGVWIGDTTSADQSYEFLAAYTGVENLTVKVIYADDPGYETTNIWASYDYGGFTFAVEYIDNEFTNNDGSYSYAGIDIEDIAESEALVFMVYKAFGDAGLTIRYTEGEATSAALGTGDYEKITISPSYAFSDNVFGLLEISEEDLEGEKETSLAAELIYSF
jgi:hypothetical protein